ncbi:MAG: oligosaccharide flippase family protein [bacterium]|nr:oligosaccharide flippase family protein [bacterium]
MSRSITRNIATLLSSRVAAQAVMLISTPLITRLFLPEHFGLMQIFESIAMPLIMIAGLRYEQSIPLGQSDREASASFLLSVFFICNMALCCLIGVLLGKEQLARWFHIPALSRLLMFLPAFVALFSLNNALSHWTAREGKFGTIAWAGLGETVGDKSAAIVWEGMLGSSATGLLFGRFVGVCATSAVLLGSQGKRIGTALHTSRITFGSLRTVAVRHKKFPLFSTWTALLMSLSFQLPVLLFGLYFSPTIVGYYSLAHRVLSLLSVFLGSAIAQVFFPTAAREYQISNTIQPIVETTFKRLIQLGAFPLLLFANFGGRLFQTVFGPQWLEAGIYAQILAPWHFLILLNLSLNVFPIFNRQELGLLFSLMSFALRAVALSIGARFWPPRLTLGCFVAFSVLLLAAQLGWKLRLSGVSVLQQARLLLAYLLFAGLTITPAAWIARQYQDFRIDLLCIVAAATAYSMGLLRQEPSLREWIVAKLKGKLPAKET